MLMGYCTKFNLLKSNFEFVNFYKSLFTENRVLKKLFGTDYRKSHYIL